MWLGPHGLTCAGGSVCILAMDTAVMRSAAPRPAGERGAQGALGPLPCRPGSPTALSPTTRFHLTPSSHRHDNTHSLSLEITSDEQEWAGRQKAANERRPHGLNRGERFRRTHSADTGLTERRSRGDRLCPDGSGATTDTASLTLRTARTRSAHSLSTGKDAHGTSYVNVFHASVRKI